jgi:hypothetical protein
MAYSFSEELDSIREYYEKVDSTLSADIVNSADLAQGDSMSASRPRSTPLYAAYLRQSIPIMFCMAWEKFVRDLKTADPARHKICFQDRSEKVLRKCYDPAIREIFLIRNSIVHLDGRATRDYEREFGKYKEGEKIAEINQPEIDRQREIFSKAFERITSSPIASLP